ncbi:MAG: (d)CMP kinase [Phycisphaeraceae bacterium]|nr:(d)CMP kinase [Phycisphaeraceae bacterium]
MIGASPVTAISAEPIAVSGGVEVKVRVCERTTRVGQIGANQTMSDDGRIIITIDGPAATGKSSVAHALARRLNFDFLDTGAMYRAAALLAVEADLWRPIATAAGAGAASLDPADRSRIVDLVRTCDLEFDWGTPTPTLRCDGRNVMGRLRDDDVTAAVGPVSGIADLRTIMVAKQQAIGAAHPRLVTEGRDQGAVVFPDAAVKFFLDADPMVRASRRHSQMIDRNRRTGSAEAVPSVETIRDELLRRDRADAAEGRLLRPSDALIVDTTRLNFHEVVSELERLVRERVGELASA